MLLNKLSLIFVFFLLMSCSNTLNNEKISSEDSSKESSTFSISNKIGITINN